jgi:hypothetical protein
METGPFAAAKRDARRVVSARVSPEQGHLPQGTTALYRA